MLRIDVVRKTSDQAILKIAGRLADAEVAFLDEELTHWLARAGLVILDLNGVTFIDEQGLAMLKRRPRLMYSCGLNRGSYGRFWRRTASR